MKRILIILALVSIIFSFSIKPAVAFPKGPAGEPQVTCDTFTIDPPPINWVQVTFIGDIDQKKFNITVGYAAEHPKIAIAHVSNLTHSTTNAQWVTIHAESKFLGISKTMHYQLLCPKLSKLPFTGSELEMGALGVVLMVIGTIAGLFNKNRRY